MLTGKHLKYSSDFSKEDFVEIYEALIEQGWTNSDGDIEKSWNYFRGGTYNYFRHYDSSTSDKVFVTSSGPDSGYDGTTKITPEELLSQIRKNPSKKLPKSLLFKGRHLKYTSEVTKEMYKEVYEALRGAGYRDCDDTFESSWGYFQSSTYGHLTDYTKETTKYSGSSCICVTSSVYGTKEISFSEILSQIRGTSYFNVEDASVNKKTFFPKVEEIL